MGAGGYCRNCLGDWLHEAATDAGTAIDHAAARSHIYGMHQADWKAKHQTEATPKQLARMAGSVERNKAMAAAQQDGYTRSDHSNHDTGDTMNENASAEQLRLFIERIETLEEEKKGIADDIKDVYGEAKGTGFDTKTMKAIVRLRKMEANARAEAEALLDTYKTALGLID